MTIVASGLDYMLALGHKHGMSTVIVNIVNIVNSTCKYALTW